MLPDIEPSDLLTVLKSGFNGVSEGGSAEIVTQVAATATATTSPVAGALLPVVAVGLSQDKAVEIGARTDQKLEETIENLDKTDRKQAILIQALRGISTFLPDGNQWREATIQSANGDPEALIELLEEYQENSEKRRSYEEAATKVLTGDISDEIGEEENFVDFLRDRFNVDTRDQALSMFLDIRDVMKSREVHETLENTYDIQSDIESVQEELNDAENRIKAKIDSVLEAGLEDEGFVRLNPLYFKLNKPEAPKHCWRIGFELEDIRAGYAADRLLEDSTPLSESLIKRLSEGNDLVLKGPPGVGKSTVCKQVALSWFESQRGTVFYRQSNRERFTRHGILSERIRDAEGHVLVVVEDAIRDESREILSTIKRFQNEDSVSFLLDSREQEWHESDRKISDPRILATKNNEIEFSSVPKLDESECASIIDHFEAITDTRVEDDPESLLKEVQTETGAGEILHLSYHLSFYASHPLSSEDPSQITSFEKKIENIIENLRSHEISELALRISILINLLNGTDLDVRPEYLHALSGEDWSHETIGDLMDVMDGQLIFNPEEPAHEAVEPFRTNHEFWSVLYLKNIIDTLGKREAARIFGDSVSALFELVDDKSIRESINYYFQQEMPQLSNIGQEPNKYADEFVRKIFELGRRRPMLAPLYGRTEYSQINLPEHSSPELKALSAMWRGIMYYNGADIEQAREELNKAREIVDETKEIPSTTGQYIQARCLCYIGAGDLRFRGREFDTAGEHLLQSKALFENIENELERGFTTGLGFVLVNLGRFNRRKGSFEDARDYLMSAIELFENKGTIRWKTIAMNHLGLVERDRGNLAEAREVLSEAIEFSQDIADLKYQARCLNSLGEVEENAGQFEKAEEYYKRALKLMQKVGDKQGKEYIYHNLGKISLSRDDFEDAEEHFRKSLELTQEIGKTRGEGISYIYLGRVARAQNQFDDAERYLNKAQDLVQEVGGGNNRRVAESLYVRGLVARDKGQLNLAERLLTNALEMATDIGDRKTEAEVRSELGNLKIKCGQLDRARHFLNEGLSIEKNVNNRKNMAYIYGNLGIIELETENINKVDKHLERSRNIMVTINNSRGIAYSDLHLGQMYHSQNNHKSAITKIEKALEIFEKTGDKRRCAKCYIALGQISHDRKNYNRAEDNINKAIDIAQTVGDQFHLAEAEAALGYTLLDRENLEEVPGQLLQASERFQKAGAPIKAKEVLSKGLEIGRRRDNEDIVVSVREQLSDFRESDE